ncbi:hypothetical protein NRIC_00860 [Enterococcus florum]|uniref:Uncharacterized protein n=1 Tax=Enterococcus florum TaxID=2480627 RepID=A0A4P5P391_9ENTE|nr:GAP family protein [Enterococcus florum]GCF92195.1 hypothetical protein NRIC_00860 [Enterococcus florum]
MFALVSATFVTSALDSLNPVAIAQQLSFQALSKNKRDIRGFILGIGLTNFLAGLLVYQGLNQLIQRFYHRMMSNYPFAVPVIALLSGTLLMVYLFKKKPVEEYKEKTISRLNMSKLFGLGIIACLLELTSALPYFAFLGILVSYQVGFFQLVAILFFYNLIYVAPLIVLYIFSIYFEERLTNFYHVFNRLIHWLLRVVVPPILFVIACCLLFYGTHYFIV